jgi:patatin-related protein
LVTGQENKMIEVVRETRFAVVMYGGVSLAIYINGVAQELLRLVRATAVEEDEDDFRVAGEDLTGVESLYRDISLLVADRSLIGDPLLMTRYCKWLNGRRKGESPLQQRLRSRGPDTKIKTTRFVVDILSGTSAGGINGVYLAKALVSGQRLDALEELWCSEGSFAKLLNDAESVRDVVGDETVELGLAPQDPPRSLLNSERLYLKLLTAFEAMDHNAVKHRDPEVPFVDEIDLFVTLTDFWGIPVPLRLYDQLIYERRHRQNLHFRYRKDDKLNEFAEKYYPFLAFAARSTSSFPLAFEPMLIESANSIIQKVLEANGNAPVPSIPRYNISEDIWKNAFKPTTLQIGGGESRVEWNKRVFVDGGYLDNKPFGYAIEALAQKQSDVLVDRKLIYVEPQPDLDDGQKRMEGKTPGVIENTRAALTSMPRYETIREDLQEVLERNDLIVRINQLVTDARKDELDSLRLSFTGLDQIVRRHSANIAGLIKKYGDGTPESKRETVRWDNLELSEIAQQKGPIAYPYYRLRVAALTDSLARMVTHRAGYDEESDYYLAVRDLVLAWRRKRFSRGEEEDGVPETRDPKAATPMLFLRDFDFDYRLRRLRFVLQQADRLLQFDQTLQRELSKTAEVAAEVRASRGEKTFSAEEKRALLTEFALVDSEIFDIDAITASEILWNNRGSEDLCKTVRSFKKSINDVLRELRTELRQVQPRAEVDPDNPNKGRIEDLNRLVGEAAEQIGVKLKFLLGIHSETATETQLDSRNNSATRQKRAEQFLEEREDVNKLLNQIGEKLEQIYNGPQQHISVFGKSRKRIGDLFYGDVLNSEEQSLVLNRIPSSVPNDLFIAIRSYLLHFYENFDAYDQIIFPITYKTPIGEGAVIDVARISPLDSTNLIDERRERREEAEDADDQRIAPGVRYKARHKLAGGVFMSFGAFFAEAWRRNDILWGRLDAVERLVSIVLNDNLLADSRSGETDGLRESLSELRQAMTNELHETILEQTDWVRDVREKYSKTPGAKRHSSFVAFVRDKEQRLIDRSELSKDATYNASFRSSVILEKVMHGHELGKLRVVKDLLLGSFGLMMKQRPAYFERTIFVRKFLTGYAVILAATYLLGVLTLTPAIITWLSTGSNLATMVVFAATLLLYLIVLNVVWRRTKRSLRKLIYAKVTGSDG